MATSSSSSQFGVVAANMYVPNQYVSQTSLEDYDGVSPGKYTKGLGQTKMAFVNGEEDIVSMVCVLIFLSFPFFPLLCSPLLSSLIICFGIIFILIN